MPRNEMTFFHNGDAPYNRSVHKFSNIGEINDGDEIFDVIYDRHHRDNLSNAYLKHGNNEVYCNA